MFGRFLLSVLILFQVGIIATNSYAQIRVVSNETCELQNAYADAAISKAVGNLNVIVIAKLGAGENSLKYSEMRLQLIKERIDLTIPPERTALAYGGRVKGKGRVEIYISGRLEAVFEASLKRNLAVGDCTISYAERQKSLLKTKLPHAP